MRQWRWLSMRCAVLLSICLSVSGVSAADLPYGKLLHDTECLTCHKETHYTRQQRLVHSLPELRKRVAYCRDDVGAEWDAAETEEVVQYLNTGYYRF
ncbi:MAG: hypothetical protein HZB57_05295 [Gammaproteobacteria bacterium]|nr:hypothetical protein [Gammaproteobacteria bacterium]